MPFRRILTNTKIYINIYYKNREKKYEKRKSMKRKKIC